MAKIAGVILDAVGTTIEPVPGVADVYLAEAFRQGMSLEREAIRERFRAVFAADEDSELRGRMTTSETLEHQRWRRIVTTVLDELPRPDDGFARLWDHFAQPVSWRCFPDVSGSIEALRSRGLVVCIGSNFDARLRSVVAGLPEIAFLADEGLVISSEVGLRKPHPGFYEAACRRLGLPPDRVACVGDDWENDVAGPLRAGLGAIWLDRRGQGPATRSPRISDLRQLLAWLDAVDGSDEFGHDGR